MLKKLFNKLYSPAVEFVMSSDEKKLFIDTIKKSANYLEFGSGGSTLAVLKHSAARVTSVESDLQWIKLLKKSPFISRNLKRQRLKLVHIDIGETRKWGFPKGTKKRMRFPMYSTEVFNMMSAEPVDTVLVDGRFRVACVLSTLIHVNNPNITILIHDFTNRPHYHIVLKYLEVINQADSLVVCRRKHNLPIDQLQSDYASFQFNPK